MRSGIQMSRMLAAKAALACRVDALSEPEAVTASDLGLEHRAYLERRVKSLAEQAVRFFIFLY